MALRTPSKPGPDLPWDVISGDVPASPLQSPHSPLFYRLSLTPGSQNGPGLPKPRGPKSYCSICVNGLPLPPLLFLSKSFWYFKA